MRFCVIYSLTLLLLLCAGCAQHRIIAIPKVSHIDGQIKTKYTYRLVKPYELRSIFEETHPEVFSSSSSSIPFTLQEGEYEHDDFTATDAMGAMLNGALFAASCFSFPLIDSHEFRVSYNVQVGKKPSNVGDFKLYQAHNGHGSLIGPLGLLFPYGEPSDIAGGRKYWRSYSSIFAGDDEMNHNKKEDQKIIDTALAYGVAVTLKKMEDEGKINLGMLPKTKPVHRFTPSLVEEVKSKPNIAPAPKNNFYYKILLCERESGRDFAYKFVLQLTEDAQRSLQAFRAVQREFRNALREDYAEAFSVVELQSLYVDFPEYRQNEGKIEGRAVVLTISVVSLIYDPNTRTGKLAVKVNANQYEEARKWVRKNIETLARDKNIALVTGEIPSAAKFYLGREELKDGNILEIEFRTE